MATTPAPVYESWWWVDRIAQPISMWGVRSDGTAYFNAGGVAPGDAAAIQVGPQGPLVPYATLTVIGGKP